MKTVALIFIFLSIGSVYGENKNNEISSLNLEMKSDKSPCEKAPESQECKDFIKKEVSEYPCANDLIKYCVPKNHTEADIDNNIKNADGMNKCLENNMKKLSKACQDSLDSEMRLKECIERSKARCSGLSADKEIDCMANLYSKDDGACKK